MEGRPRGSITMIHPSRIVNVVLYIPANADIEIIRDMLDVVKRVIEKNYGIRVHSSIDYSRASTYSIEIDGTLIELRNQGIPDIKDLIDIIVMSAIPFTDPAQVGLKVAKATA